MTAANITAHVRTDALLSVLLNARYHLVGDENGGVGLGCRDHFDGGQPLGYYESYPSTPVYPVDEVVHVDTIPALLAVAMRHETTAHGSECDSVDIPGVPDSIPRARVIELVRSLGLDPRELASLELKGRCIEAVIYALDDEGHRYFVDTPTGPVATHHISIPITDDAPQRKET